MYRNVRRSGDLSGLENNLALQEPLYQLRSDTKEAFDDAKHLEARWKELEREQREVYQVRCILFTSLHQSTEYQIAVYPSIPSHATEARDNCSRRSLRKRGFKFCARIPDRHGPFQRQGCRRFRQGVQRDAQGVSQAGNVGR